jgi:hypothetical protein
MRPLFLFALLVIGGCSGGASMPAPLQTGPVTVENPSARLVAQGAYNVTFMLKNGSFGSKEIARADLLRMTWGGQALRVNFECTGQPFVGEGSATSPVITIGLRLLESSAVLSAECSSSPRDYEADGLPAAAPKSGDTIVVAVDGILSDATPFTATANAPVL